MFRDMQAREDWNIRQAKAAVSTAAKMLVRQEPGTHAYDTATRRLKKAKERLAEQENFYKAGGDR